MVVRQYLWGRPINELVDLWSDSGPGYRTLDACSSIANRMVSVGKRKKQVTIWTRGASCAAITWSPHEPPKLLSSFQYQCTAKQTLLLLVSYERATWTLYSYNRIDCIWDTQFAFHYYKHSTKRAEEKVSNIWYIHLYFKKKWRKKKK